MSRPFESQEVCPKCGWKSNVINISDCIVGHYGECPKCGTKTERERPDLFEKIKVFFKQNYRV